MGRVKKVERDITPRGIPILVLVIEDTTGRCKVDVYYQESFEKIAMEGNYIKIGVNIKCGGLVYRPEKKITSSSVAALEDFN